MNGFDAYCEENDIPDEELPQAFAAYLHQLTGWSGEYRRVEEAPDAPLLP